MTLPLVTRRRVSLGAARQWAIERGAHPIFVEQMLPALYTAVEAQRTANGGRAVDFGIVAAQSAKETGWGKFGGVIDASWRNTAGIKIAEGGGNFVPDAHERFRSWTEGARAHLNHLAAYTGLATVGEPHGRYFVVARLSWAGTIKSLDQLSGRWAPSPSYADSIEENTRIIHKLDESSGSVTDVLVAVGHGRRPNGTFDPGACASGSGRCEQQEGDPVVAAVTDTLRGLGLTVREVRLGGPNFVGASDLANRLGVRAAVEIHHDWIGAPRGAGGFWYPGSRPSKRLADSILSRVTGANIAIHRPAIHRARNLGWTRMTNMPAVLWELDRIGTVSRKVDYGVAVAAGIADFLGVNVAPPPVDDSGGSDIPVFTSSGIGLVRGNRWLLKTNLEGGAADHAFHFGRPDDIPLGGGGTIAVRRGSQWFVRTSESGGDAHHTFHFGRASDRPILIPGTRHTSAYPAVVRGDRWLVKRSFVGGPAEFDFRFGRPGDIPLAGSWTGLGGPGVGVFRDGVFYLRGSLSGGGAHWAFHFGRKGDIPIVWRDHAGRDRVGVRRGRTWYLRNTLSGGPADKVFIFGR